jgi:demethylmenaquinone methyltransferase/2-methoxy-6-polyprenyl-1,4-benzoquinol methylase
MNIETDLSRSGDMIRKTPSHHELNRTFYDRISRAYDLLCDAGERPARQAGLELLAPQSGERVLEVGCGTGSELLAIAHRVAPSGRVCGLDLSSGMLDVARKKVEVAPTPAKIEMTEGDARKLPFADAAFDAVYTSFTLELFTKEDLRVVLTEIRRVLGKEGRLGVVSMAKVRTGEHPSIAERAYVWFHRHFPHIVDCRPIDIDRVLETGRFTVIRRVELDVWSIPVIAAVAMSRANALTSMP